MTDVEPLGLDLRGYARAKFDLSDILQSIVATKIVEKDRSLQERLQDLLVRLAEDRFNLFVAGRFSRGKSSLMNAILGMDRLPTGILPLTSVVTTVSYGTSEAVTLKFRERRLDQQIGLDELPQYVTQRGNPGNRQGISVAHIELPAEILRLGFHFVDTPGLGSAVAENSLATKAFLPEGDALLLVTSFESPLSGEELEFLRVASRANLPIFVAINKQDLISQEERSEAIDFVTSHLKEFGEKLAQNVFSVSAREGLLAKLSCDRARLDESGLPTLESRLTRFLLEQKRTLFLARMYVRTEQLLEDLPFFDELPILRQRLRGLSEHCRVSAVTDYWPAIAGDREPTFHQGQLRSCEICAAIETQLWNFLTRYQYELSRSAKCQIDFARRSGFCSYHTFEYKSIASPFGTCSGYPSLLERIADLFRSAAHADGAVPLQAIDDALPSHDKCLLCEVRDKAEILAISDLVNQLRDGGAVRVENLSALCLPHLATIADTLNDPETVRSLMRREALILERTAQDMRGFTLKQSAARRHLESSEEETAAHRALLILAGQPSVNFAFRQSSQRPPPDLKPGRG